MMANESNGAFTVKAEFVTGAPQALRHKLNARKHRLARNLDAAPSHLPGNAEPRVIRERGAHHLTPASTFLDRDDCSETSQ